MMELDGLYLPMDSKSVKKKERKRRKQWNIKLPKAWKLGTW